MVTMRITIEKNERNGEQNPFLGQLLSCATHLGFQVDEKKEENKPLEALYMG